MHGHDHPVRDNDFSRFRCSLRLDGTFDVIVIVEDDEPESSDDCCCSAYIVVECTFVDVSSMFVVLGRVDALWTALTMDGIGA